MTPNPRLYHAPSSYYSAIARLALVEGGVAFEPVAVDIHRRKQQIEPAYVRINPGMTVPTLELADRVLVESRDILDLAFPDDARAPATRALVDEHYAFPVDELTFSWLLSWNPLARRFVPKTLRGMEARLRAFAVEQPDLAPAYLARAEVFHGRVKTFDPDAISALWETRLAAALERLDALEALLADGREVLAPPRYGAADVVWTVFLARMGFVRLGHELERRSHVARYARAMKARPSFAAADIWDRIKLIGVLRQIV
jgi:tetrachloro-p-hydroquinone reductive dehalogenase